jgi:hypothetical protein
MDSNVPFSLYTSMRRPCSILQIVKSRDFGEICTYLVPCCVSNALLDQFGLHLGASEET